MPVPAGIRLPFTDNLYRMIGLPNVAIAGRRYQAETYAGACPGATRNEHAQFPRDAPTEPRFSFGDDGNTSMTALGGLLRKEGWACAPTVGYLPHSTPVPMPTSNASRRGVCWFLPVLGVASVIAAACGGGGDNGPTQPARSDTTLTASLDGGTSFTAATATITSAN